MPDLIFLLVQATALILVYVLGLKMGRRDCPDCAEFEDRLQNAEVALEDIRLEARDRSADLGWIERRASAALSPYVSDPTSGAPINQTKVRAGLR